MLAAGERGGNLCDYLNSYVPLCYVARSLNEDADSLAKSGLSRPNLVSYWTDGWVE